MRYMILITLCCMTILLACSGKDKITVDKIRPIPPILVPHKGDLGDISIVNGAPVMQWNDENNGIDAVPDGDWLRVSWEHLLDSDLDFIKIYRFDEFDPIPVIIDTMQYNQAQDFYLDSKSSLLTNRRYSYFIELVDNAGNTSLSDTVSYSLLSKQILSNPAADSTSGSPNVKFKWRKSGIVSWFRLILFKPQQNTNDEREYLWHTDVQATTTEGDVFEATAPVGLLQDYMGQYVIWRVDAFEWDSELQIFIGSESNERTLYLSSK